MLFVIVFAALFSVMNPLGTVPVFVGLTKDDPIKIRSKTAFYTSLNVLIILFLSFFAGKYILNFFGISLNSLKIAGGMIITMKKPKVVEDIKTRSDISLTPLALPMLAGPGTISLLISYQQTYLKKEDVLIILSAIVFTTIMIYFILKSSFIIVKILGASGINALSRIIGFIVISIGVEYIVSSVTSILKDNLM